MATCLAFYVFAPVSHREVAGSGTGCASLSARNQSSLLGCAWVSGAQLCNDEWLFAMCMLCIFSRFAAVAAGAAGGESWPAAYSTSPDSDKWLCFPQVHTCHRSWASVFGAGESRNKNVIVLQQKRKLKSGVKPFVNGLSGAKRAQEEWGWSESCPAGALFLEAVRLRPVPAQLCTSAWALPWHKIRCCMCNGKQKAPSVFHQKETKMKWGNLPSENPSKNNSSSW